MSPRTRLAARSQRGTILFIALIVLVAMSLAGIALMRSVDTNVLIAANLAFRQGATAGGDWGVEDARAWISGNAAILNDDMPPGARFYLANWQQNLDLIRQYELRVAAPSDGFIFVDSDRRLLTRAEVAPLGKEQLAELIQVPSLQ